MNKGDTERESAGILYPSHDKGQGLRSSGCMVYGHLSGKGKDGKECNPSTESETVND